MNQDSGVTKVIDNNISIYKQNYEMTQENKTKAGK